MSFIGGQAAATLSPSQIYQLAVKHGFAPGQEAATATAIALGESSGITNNFNPKDSHGGSVGLMQINGANAHLIGGDNWKTTGTDPDASMAAAHALYSRKGNFTDWGAYTDGSYKKFYNQAANVASTPITYSPISGASTPGTTLTSTPAAAVSRGTPTPALSPYQMLQKGDVPGALSALAVNKTDPKTGEEQPGTSPLGKLGTALHPQQQQQSQQLQSEPLLQPQDTSTAMIGPSQQLFAQMLAASAKPLSWSSRPYGSGAGLQVPGTTLNATGGLYG